MNAMEAEGQRGRLHGGSGYDSMDYYGNGFDEANQPLDPMFDTNELNNFDFDFEFQAGGGDQLDPSNLPLMEEFDNDEDMALDPSLMSMGSDQPAMSNSGYNAPSMMTSLLNQSRDQSSQQQAYQPSPYAMSHLPGVHDTGSITINPARLLPVKADPQPARKQAASSSSTAGPSKQRASASSKSSAPAAQSNPVDLLKTLKNLISKENLNLVNAPEPSPFSRVVTLLKPTSSVPNASSKGKTAEAVPKLRLTATQCADFMTVLNKNAPKKYLLRWSRNSDAISILAFYLEQAIDDVEEDDGGAWLDTSLQIVVFLNKLDPSFKMITEHGLGKLVMAQKKSFDKFKAADTEKTSELKKGMKTFTTAIKEKMEKMDREDGSPVATMQGKREASEDADRDRVKKSKVDGRPALPASKPRATSSKPTVETSRTTKSTTDVDFFGAGPSKPVVRPTAAKPSSTGGNALTATLAGMLGKTNLSADSPPGAGVKDDAKMNRPPRIGKNGQPRPRMSVRWKPDWDLSTFREIEPRDTEHDQGGNTKDLDMHEGRLLKQHAVEEDQSWYTPELLLPGSMSDSAELQSEELEERKQAEASGVSFAPIVYLADQDVPQTADERNVQIITEKQNTIEIKRRARETLLMDEGGIFMQQGMPQMPQMMQSQNYGAGPSMHNGYQQFPHVGSPYGLGAPPVAAPQQGLDIGATLASLRNIMPGALAPAPNPAQSNDRVEQLLAQLMKPNAAAPIQQQPVPQFGGGGFNGGFAFGHPNAPPPQQYNPVYGGPGPDRNKRGSRGGRGPHSSGKPCRFFARGNCRKGDNCFDMHGGAPPGPY